MEDQKKVYIWERKQDNILIVGYAQEPDLERTEHEIIGGNISQVVSEVEGLVLNQGYTPIFGQGPNGKSRPLFQSDLDFVHLVPQPPSIP